MMKNLILLTLAFTLSACLVNEPTETTITERPDPNAPVAVYSPSINIPIGAMSVNERSNFSYTHTFSSAPVAIGYSISNKPDWATFNTSTGEISGIAKFGLYTFEITKVMAASSEESGEISVFVLGDPLYQHSWHLENTGQSAYSSGTGSAGEDIRITGNIDTYTGNGINVLVSDTGVDYLHEDLDSNLDMALSKNYNSSSYPFDNNGHGTAVAGLIAAEAFNNVGSRGVASQASIVTYNFLEAVQSSTNLIDQANHSGVDIFNYSYGDLSYHDQKSDQDYFDQLEYATTNFRNGKGSIFVKAAGNEFFLQPIVNSAPVYSHNANMPLDNESPYMIVVGATNALGQKALYSNAGSNLWITAPGGSADLGEDSPALISTDVSGCSKGWAAFYENPLDYINSFEYGHADNPVCNYTSTMNGTSGATPIVSGAIALILEANNSLTWRDVKHILASTARQVHAGATSTPHPTKLYFPGDTRFDLAGHTYEQGWVTNAAGYKFHNWYGFGQIDVDAAIAMAQTYSVNLGTYASQSSSSAPDATIPDNSNTGLSDTINLTSSLIVESVEISVVVEHNNSGEIGLELVSPSGTKSILLNINNSLLLGSDINLDVDLLSNAFYGENANGNWTLKAIDGASGVTGKLKSWTIKVNGH